MHIIFTLNISDKQRAILSQTFNIPDISLRVPIYTTANEIICNLPGSIPSNDDLVKIVTNSTLFIGSGYFDIFNYPSASIIYIDNIIPPLLRSSLPIDKLIAQYINTHPLKMRGWVEDWVRDHPLSKSEGSLSLSRNPNAISWLENHLDKIYGPYLSMNPNAIPLLMQNFGKIEWGWLTMNPNAMFLIENNLHKIDWESLSANPNAISILEKYPDKISWSSLSANPNAMHLLEQNPDKINWTFLSRNPSAISLLEKNPDKINWSWLSSNYNAMHLLEKNPDKISMLLLSENPNPKAIQMIERDRKIHWSSFLANPGIFVR